MGHEWKIGDWAEYVGTRCLVFDVRNGLGGSIVDVVNHANAEWRDGCEDAIRSPSCDHTELKHLPACTGWDWQPPKPIEAPPGYRLMERKEIVKEGDVYFTRRMGGPRWECTGSGALGCTVAYRMENYGEPAYARKIEPGYVERQAEWVAKHCLKIGDKVKVLRNFSTEESGWKYVNNQQHALIVGKVLPVEKIDTDSIWLAGFEYVMPYFVLEKIEPKYRPFASAEEFKPHREKWVYFLGDISNQLLITSFTAKGIWHAGKHTTWEAMFSQARFEDASPFGVLESNPLPVP